MHEDDLLMRLRADLYTALLETPTTAAFAERALDVLGEVCGVRSLGVALLEGGKAAPLAATDEDVASCERVACRASAGGVAPLAELVVAARPVSPPAALPSSHWSGVVRTGHLDAVTPGAGVRGPGTAAPGSRPPWHLAMSAVGFRRVVVLTAPVRQDGDLAVTWYHAGEPPNLPGPVALCVAELARSITLRLKVDEQMTTNADLVAAMASRATIDHAIGVLMAVHQCTADDAMVRLREASRRKNMKLRDLASSLVREVTGNSPASPAPFRARPGGVGGQPVR